MQRISCAFLLALVIGVCRAESTAAERGSFVPFPYYMLRTDLFAATPLTSRDIVFLGDSITEGGEWNELFPALPVRDRGIGGDKVSPSSMEKETPSTAFNSTTFFWMKPETMGKYFFRLSNWIRVPI